MWPVHGFLDSGALLDLPSCKTDPWKRYTCTNAFVGILGGGDGMWGLPWGLLCGISGREELCMVLCHSCHIYGIWTRWS